MKLNGIHDVDYFDPHCEDYILTQGTSYQLIFLIRNRDVKESHITTDMIDMERQLDKQRYTLFEPLGSGSYATVYRAIDNKTRTIVAVKIMRAIKNGNWVSQNRNALQWETRALTIFGCGTNRHENVVRLIEQGLVRASDTESHLWIVMENMESDLSTYQNSILQQLSLIHI